MDNENKPRILAVDDAGFMLQIIKTTLSDDYELFFLKKPEMVDGFLRHTTPDLFLLDYTMPEMNGVELAKIIRSHDKHKETPIIFVTAMGTPQHVHAAIAAGACDYVVKPINAEILQEKIRKHLETKSLNDYMETV